MSDMISSNVNAYIPTMANGTATVPSGGTVTITHGLGPVPVTIFLTHAGTPSASIAYMKATDNKNGTFKIDVYAHTSASDETYIQTSVTATVNWMAIRG